MRKFYAILLVVFAVLSANIVNGQTLRDADYAFKHNQYEKALLDYQKGLRKLSKNRIEKNRVTFQIAECYRIMGNLKKAEQQYIALQKRNYQKDNPMILFHLGNMYQSKAEYDKALKYYKEYKKRNNEDPRIDRMIEAVTKAKGWMENPTRYEVENFKKVNTRQNEWAPRWGNPEKRTQITFTSNREGSVGKGTDQWTGTAFSDIYQINKPRSKNTEWPGEWSPVTPMCVEEMLNTSVNEGEASANKKGSKLYMTRCPQDKKKVQGCYIYSAAKRGKRFAEAELIELGSDSFNYVHPFISDDELTMYFASDMPGGHGGFDIYKATRKKKNGKFTDIVNLGPTVNTDGQEVFPAPRGNNTLYFSSDGHPTLGGLDLFKTEYIDGKWSEPENLLVPINSTWDEIGIIFDESTVLDPKSKTPYVEKGYFSSNRPGGRGGDDIYYFLLRPVVFTLAGFVRDEATLQYIDGAEVEIIGSDGKSYKTKTDVKGYYSFDKTQIVSNTTYTMKVTKNNYWDENNTASQTTVGLSENTDLKQDFRLSPIPKEPILLPEILFDLAKWNLKPQYKDSLLYLYDIMVKNPTLVIELRSHTDARDTDIKNEALSQKRAQSCVDFLVQEKGIEAGRIVAKGYGEYRPRKIMVDMQTKYGGQTYTFRAGTVLTEEYINTLSPKNHKEAAHALNRRTEFIILRDDYVPQGDSIGSATSSSSIAVVQQRSTPITMDGNTIKANAFANNKSVDIAIDETSDVIYMNYNDAARFLKEMIIKVDDFEIRDKAIKPEDGSIIENTVFYLGELRFGEDYAENVPVVVKKGLKSTFVVGGQFISEEWGSFTINKEKGQLIYE